MAVISFVLGIYFQALEVRLWAFIALAALLPEMA